MTPDGQHLAFACTRCGAVLPRGANALRELEALTCMGCGASYPVNGGVPRFVADHPYWGEFPEETMADILSRASRSGWLGALQECLPGRSAEEIVYLFDTSRARWKHYFPLPQQATVLDIGSGLGAIAFGLAESGYTVVAAEPVWMRVRFLQVRAQQEGVSNIVPVCADTFDIPFPDGTFDGIVLNNVLEWVALARPDRPPGAVQQEVLGNLARKLKPGGYLHLVIENRWGPLLFSGLRDPHSGLRYTSFLPRPLASAYSQYKKGEPYRTYLYSLRGYRRLLRRAGFGELRPFALLPSSRNYFYYLPLDRPELVRFFLNTAFDPKHPGASRWMRRLSRYIPIHRLFAGLMPDFSIFARREP